MGTGNRSIGLLYCWQLWPFKLRIVSDCQQSPTSPSAISSCLPTAFSLSSSLCLNKPVGSIPTPEADRWAISISCSLGNPRANLLPLILCSTCASLSWISEDHPGPLSSTFNICFEVWDLAYSPTRWFSHHFCKSLWSFIQFSSSFHSSQTVSPSELRRIVLGSEVLPDIDFQISGYHSFTADTSRYG